MAINIKEILHPNDSDSIKFEKINYNFDQILANGGGPQGIQGGKGEQGQQGSTGVKGEKGEIGAEGPVGPAGITDTPWDIVPHTNISSLDILKPKLGSSSKPPVIWIGDQNFDEGASPAMPGETTPNSRITISNDIGTTDNYVELWHSNTKRLVTTSAIDGDYTKFSVQNYFGSTDIKYAIRVDYLLLEGTDVVDLKGEDLNIISTGNTDITISTLGSGKLAVDLPTNFAEYLNVNGTSHVKVASGTLAQRPSVGTAGMIRFNTEDVRFEGFDGTNWRGLGGLIDTDQDTYITAEENPDEDILRFVTEGTEVMTAGESVSDGYETSIYTLSVNRLQSNEDDIVISTSDRGIVFKAVTETLSSSQAQPHNEGTAKDRRRIHDYFYQPSIIMDSGTIALTDTTPFEGSTTIITTGDHGITTKLFRGHRRTSSTGQQLVDAADIAVVIKKNTSRISYVKTGHLVNVWANLEFYTHDLQTSLVPSESSGVYNFSGYQGSSAAINTAVPFSRMAIYFAELGTFSYRNASSDWIWFPIAMNLAAPLHMGLQSSAPDEWVKYWGVIPPNANYFNIAIVDENSMNHTGTGAEAGNTGYVGEAGVNFLNVGDFSMTGAATPRLTMMSYSFSMPTDENSYDVVSTIRSTYTEQAAMFQQVAPNTPVGVVSPGTPTPVGVVSPGTPTPTPIPSPLPFSPGTPTPASPASPEGRVG